MVTDLSNWSEEQEVEDEHEDASQGNKEDSSKDTEVESEQFNQENKIVSPRRGSRIRRIPERFNDYLLNSVGENRKRVGGGEFVRESAVSLERIVNSEEAPDAICRVRIWD
ncbi:hypothetical protein J6590_076352 [Homalodisca vitripennis]|nr:hypothetical protein J6590_076352 [Homalodisca vitripennis]